MKVSLISPEGVLFEGEADFVSAPGKAGSLGILDNHSALVTGLKKGDVIVRNSGEEQVFSLETGIMEVGQNQVSILCELENK